jgi:hypothetical protein
MTAADDHGDGRSPGRGASLSDFGQCRFYLAFDHGLDEFAHPVAYPSFDRIEPVVETAVSEASCEESSFVVVMLMAASQPQD